MKTERNWAIWREYRSGGIFLREMAVKYGVSPTRISQIIRRRDRDVKRVLNRGLCPSYGPLEDPVREGTLGVEFTFRLDDPFDIYDGWGEWERLYLGYDTWTWFKVNIPSGEDMGK
jgi:hypothetical protein